MLALIGDWGICMGMGHMAMAHARMGMLQGMIMLFSQAHSLL